MHAAPAIRFCIDRRARLLFFVATSFIMMDMADHMLVA
jgi:hypothetical protein